MNNTKTYAAASQGVAAAHQGRTGVEFNNKSSVWKKYLPIGFGIIAGIVIGKAVMNLADRHCKEKSKRLGQNVDIKDEKVKVEAPSVNAEVEVQTEEPVVEPNESLEVRIHKLRAEGKNYPAIAHELHVSIREISRVLKAKD